MTPPFVGRSNELAALAAAILRAPLTVVTGPAGVGKTALARELVRLEAPKAEWQVVAHVRCEEGDLACAVVARAERGLDVVPGTLEEALGQTRRLLVLDELHRLAPEAAAEL